MPDLSPDAASPSSAGSSPNRVDRGWRLLTILLATVLSLPILAALFVITEFSTATLADKLGTNPPNAVVPWLVRIVSYGLLLGGAGLTVRRFVSPQKRLWCWIGLAVVAILLLTPTSNFFIFALIAYVALHIFP